MKLFISHSFIVGTLTIASIYIISATLLMNVQLVQETLFGSFSVIYKIRLVSALMQGIWTAMSGQPLLLLVITALLTGANLALLGKQIRQLHQAKKVHLVVGGNTFLGLAGSGCAACGLPLLSVFGLSGSVLSLPFHGAEISYIAIIMLTFSLYFLVTSLQQKAYCKL